MPKKILVADDDPAVREMLRMTLEAEGYEIAAAGDGKETPRLLGSTPFDLLVLDVEMPYLDGYHLAQQISAGGRSQTPKILILTGRDTHQEHHAASLSGADAFIQKPCDLDELIRKIKQLIGT